MKTIYTHILKSSISENTDNGKIAFCRVLNNADETRKQIICEDYVVIENINIDELSFDLIDFKEGLYLRNSTIKTIVFTACNFKSKLDDKSFRTDDLNIETLSFIDCSFDGNVYVGLFGGVINNIEFQSCRINGDLLFDKIILAYDGKISVGLEDGYISGDCEFRKCTILKGIIDIRADIDGELRFCLINNTFGDDKNQFNRPFASSLEFHAVNIKKVRFYKSNFYSVSIHNAVVDDIYQQDTNIENLQYDVLKLFRDAAIKNNDDFLAQKYTGDLYDRILKDESKRHLYVIANKLDSDQARLNKSKINFSKLVKQMFEPFILLCSSFGSSERLMLWLNKYSNDFNRSWIRGVWFTMIVTLIFYFILNYCGMQSPYFVIDFRFDDFDKVVLGYINMIDITCWRDSKSIFDLTPIGGIIMFFAKLFIAYGVWQTIYAFYKYKK